MVAPVSADDPSGLLAQLAVAEEDTGAPYERPDWGEDWAIHRDSGCTTRELILLRDGPTSVKGKGCTPVCPEAAAPCWTSPYDGATWRHEDELQIDHIVSLKEASRSRVITHTTGEATPTAGPGAGRVWDATKKNAFFEDQANLVAVTASVNQAKNDLDAARWKPPLDSAQCDFAQKVVRTKLKWVLTVDPAEHDALRQMLNTCPKADPGGAGDRRT